MTKNSKNNKFNESDLYNIILALSRNKLLYTKFNVADTFQNRINLIFVHFSFIFIKSESKGFNPKHKQSYQKLFDYIFSQIEQNMRELGFGDVSVNKNMKFLVKSFYSILLYCRKYDEHDLSSKISFLNNWIKSNLPINKENSDNLVDYFDKFAAFCFDLSSDNVLKGRLNFNYKVK